MHLQSGHRRGNEGGERWGRGVNGTELCKVIYQANISNKLVKYYVIKLSAHAQQQSDMHNAHSQGRVGAGGGVAGVDWHMFRNVSINFTQHLI